MTCDDFDKLWVINITTGDTTNAEKVAMANHIGDCARCRHIAIDHLRTKQLTPADWASINRRMCKAYDDDEIRSAIRPASDPNSERECHAAFIASMKGQS